MIENEIANIRTLLSQEKNYDTLYAIAETIHQLPQEEQVVAQDYVRKHMENANWPENLPLCELVEIPSHCTWEFGKQNYSVCTLSSAMREANGKQIFSPYFLKVINSGTSYWEKVKRSKEQSADLITTLTKKNLEGGHSLKERIAPEIFHSQLIFNELIKYYQSIEPQQPF